MVKKFVTVDDLRENNKLLVKDLLSEVGKMMDERFNVVNDQFIGINERLNHLDIRFGNLEDRVDLVENNMNKRFDKVDADIEDVYNAIQHGMGTMFSLLDEKYDPRVLKLEKHVFPAAVI